MPATDDPHPPSQQIPTYWWLAGLVASAALATAVLSPMLHLPPYEPLVAVAMYVLPPYSICHGPVIMPHFAFSNVLCILTTAQKLLCSACTSAAAQWILWQARI